MQLVFRISTLFFTLLVLNSCFDYKDVEFKGMQGFNIEDRTDDAITIRVDMKVNNPNNYNIKVKKSTLDVYLNNKYVGKTKMKKSVVLKKKREGVYPVYLKTTGKDLMKSAMGSLGSLLSGQINLGVKGDVKAGAYGISKKFPIDVTQNVSLKGMF